MEMAAFANDELDFVFSLNNNSAIASISEVSGVGFKSQQVITGKPRQDLIGGELDRIQVKGVTYGITDGSNIETLYAIKDAEKPITYVESGKNRGLWVIKQVSVNKKEIMPNGATQNVDFTVSIEEFANE